MDRIRQFIFDLEYVLEIFDEVFELYITNDYNIDNLYNKDDLKLISKIHHICTLFMIKYYDTNKFSFDDLEQFYEDEKIKGVKSYNEGFKCFEGDYIPHVKDVLNYTYYEVKKFLKNNKNYI